MTFADIVVILLLVLAVISVFLTMKHGVNSGNNPCGGNCAGCPGCSTVKKDDDAKEN